MIVIETPGDLRKACDDIRAAGGTVGFVPTMGALHEGHLRLVDEAKNHASSIVVSIFVNPTQFGPNEDFAKYPRTLEKDRTLLEKRGAHLLFCPTVPDMYPEDSRTTVHVADLTDGLCGAHRPGHFDGVATIVAKLLCIVGPCTAVFGRKDYQQLQVISRMTADLHLPVTVVGMPTVRDPDGLAMSSRNAYLSAAQRNSALCIPRSLALAHQRFNEGAPLSGIEEEVRETLSCQMDAVDYVTIADPRTLLPLPGNATPASCLLAVAARIGSTRLIDNTVLGEDIPPDIAPTAEHPL